jgi:hypothetical protein
MKYIDISNLEEMAIVDDEDYERVSKHSWCGVVGRNTVYAQTRIKGESIYLHRFVMQSVKFGPKIDHKNGNGLDCRKSNLRVATDRQQMGNSKHQVGASGYRGVWMHPNGRFRAHISIDNTLTHLGYYDTAEEAAQAYDRAALAHFGVFATLNIPGV